MISSKGDNKSVTMKDDEDLPTISEDEDEPLVHSTPKKHKPSSVSTKRSKKKLGQSSDSESENSSKPKSVKKKKKTKIDGEASEEFSKPKSVKTKKKKVVSGGGGGGAAASSDEEEISAKSSKRKSVTKKKISTAYSSEEEELSVPSSKRKSIKNKKRNTTENGNADQPQRRQSVDSVAMGGRGKGGRGRGSGPGRSAPSARGVTPHHSMPDSPTKRKPQSMSTMNSSRKPQSMNPMSPASPRSHPTSSPSKSPTMMGLNGSVHPPAGRGTPMRGGRGRGRGRGRGPRPMSTFQLDTQMPAAPIRHPSTAYHAPKRPMSMQELNRGGSGDGMAPPPPSKMESAPPNSRGTSFYGAPPKPSSILRSSGHRRPTMTRTASSSRMNPDGSVTTAPADDENMDEERPMVSPLSSILGSFHTRDGMDDSGHSGRPSLSSMGTSTRLAMGSVRDLGQSYMGKMGVSFRKTQLSKFQSTRSILTADQELEEEPSWKQFLRYIRILPPHPDEKPIKKNIRLMTWAALFCDFLAAIVSITTYGGVSECCDKPVLSIAGNINWNTAVRVTTYVYLVMIFAEILPVIREGMPFNLLNPFVGFLITFAVFFDDRILEAVIMWIIEASAVSCEVAVYRLQIKLFNQREERLNQTEADMKQFRDGRKKKKLQRVREESGDEDSDEEESSSGDSFHDETEDDSEDPTSPTSTENVDLSNRRELRLMRDRRFLRQAQSEERRALRYHFGGVAFNVGLVGITMLLILCIGRSGGLCIKDMQPPNVFKKNQLDVCYDCKGSSDVCEICRDDGTSHCYYPYY